MIESITIASGKGGVGKTCVAVNLALTLARQGRRVALLDADFGLANAHILMGCDTSLSMREVLSGACSIEEAMVATRGGVRLIAGGAGATEMRNLDALAQAQAIRAMDGLSGQIDLLIVDAPAGAGDGTLGFMAASDRVLVVIVGEPTSFMDGYALIKAAAQERGLRRFSILVNMARNGAEAQAQFDRFRAIVARFLDVELSFAGHLPFSAQLRRSVIARTPVVQSHPAGPEALALSRAGQALLRGPANDLSGLRFFQDARLRHPVGT
ncbi:P-loop NTPase [Plastorhodobacter daqingensis]|uniref:P-loop NTPase n=1 Tax=Plastorhodobacter daqingensis TaxID=1387281 RepID=A0ABW2UG23_9RHOB